MTAHKPSKRRVALIGLPLAAALVLGTAGFAFAAETPAAPSPSSSSVSAQGGGHADGDGGHADAEKKPSYTSSVRTTAEEHAGSEAAGDLALTKLAKIDLGAAAKAAVSAVPGGAATDASLDNESGNVVYTVDVTSGTQETEVVVDAGNGAILAKTVDNGD